MTTLTNLQKRHLKECKNVSLDKAGVDAWGVYVLFVDTNKWGENYEHRVFIADKLVCTYRMEIGGAKTRTTWQRRNVDSREEALAWLAGTSTKAYGGALAPVQNRAMVGAPVLVQLTESDVENVRKGRMPNARYRGQQKHTSIYGKVNAVTALAFNLKGGFPDPSIRPEPVPVSTLTVTPATPEYTSTPTTAVTTSSWTTSVIEASTGEIEVVVHNVASGPVGDEPF